MKHVAWVVLAASLGLQACESSAGMRGRLAAGIGSSRLTDKDPGDTTTFSGMQQSVRMEVVQQLDYIDNVEVGLRLKGGSRQLDNTVYGIPPVGTYETEFDTNQLGLMPTFRGVLPMSGATRLYAETFVGYEHYWGEFRSLGFKDEGDDGGLTYGVGAGVEFGMGNDRALGVGFEWARADGADAIGDAYFDDFSLIVSWSFGF